MARTPHSFFGLRLHDQVCFHEAPSHTRTPPIVVGGVIACVASVSAQAQSQCGFGWGQSQAPGPAGRSGHVMAYDALNQRSVVVGGTILGVFTSEMWRYNGNWLQITSSPRPSAREGAAMVYDSNRQREILFSGYSGLTGAGIVGGYENATWELSSAGWVVRSLTGPAPRAGHVMIYQTAPTDRTLLFGGSNRPNLQVPTTRLADTWEWNAATATWTQLNVSGPSARDFAAMAFDSARRVGVLFGGIAASVGTVGDTWEWDSAAQAWSHANIPGPVARYDASLVYDPNRNICLLFGGVTGLSASDTWQYSGSAGGAWSQLLTTVSPSRRNNQGMAYDLARRTVVMYGGQAGLSYLGDTWEGDFTGWPIVTSRPLSLTLPTGCTAVFATTGVSTPRNLPISFQWRFNGVPLVDDGRISGSSTDTLTIASTSASDAGSYDVILTTGCGAAQSTGASLTLVDPVSIIAQPSDARPCSGGPAVFDVGVAGGVSPGMQWLWQPDPGDPGLIPVVEGDNLDPVSGLVAFTASGASTSTLTVTADALSRSLTFSCRVTDACSLVDSNSATLTPCVADFNCENGVTVQDLFDFLAAWFAGDPRADINGVNGVTVQDIFDFLAAWFAGCP